MARARFQTLTEQMFYTLLCLKEECGGIDILDRVPAMTGGRVSIGSGTLYTLLEQFLEAEMIRAVSYTHLSGAIITRFPICALRKPAISIRLTWKLWATRCRRR